MSAEQTGSVSEDRFALRHSSEFGLETVKILLIRLRDEMLHLVKLFFGLEFHGPGQPGLVPAHVFEQDRGLEGMQGFEMGKNNLLVLDDFLEHTDIREVLTAGAMHREMPDPARLELKALEGIREPLRPPPGSQMLRVFICPPDL